MSLVATLEHPLPATLPAGTATALFVSGSCAEPVEVSVDGMRHARGVGAGAASGPSCR